MTHFFLGTAWKGLAALLLLATTAPYAAEPAPFADVHLHYSWDQAEQLSAQEAIRRLQRNQVVLGVVSSTPPELALELRAAGGAWIVPLYRPYFSEVSRRRWYADPRTLDAARTALASKRYFGIGEIHLNAGLGPAPDNPILDALIELATDYDVPVLIHTETSSHKYFLPICRRHPRARFLWAHAGGLLDADEVGALMATCSNVWVEFSARDPWKYTTAPITTAQGQLTKGWQQLVTSYPERFMTGSDPVWPVENKHSWDEPDTGWDMLDELVEYHRTWIDALPPAVAAKVRSENALNFFRQTGRE